ncbi:MAG: MFS transporter, partial [Candidatus Tectomicrobia bacterium]|nr:MFS transporter [Candidatus Tectomicrobia bacterium]
MRSLPTQVTTPAPVETGRLFGALRSRNFRYLWFAFTAGSLAQRMDGVLLGWLVLELTDSAFMVGLVGSMRFLGALLGPVTGVIADRCDRRRLLMFSMLAMTAVVVVLLGLMTVRRLDVWSLFLATTLWGVLRKCAISISRKYPMDYAFAGRQRSTWRHGGLGHDGNDCSGT